jgi:homoserine dehydrogenase
VLDFLINKIDILGNEESRREGKRKRTIERRRSKERNDGRDKVGGNVVVEQMINNRKDEKKLMNLTLATLWLNIAVIVANKRIVNMAH